MLCQVPVDLLPTLARGAENLDKPPSTPFNGFLKTSGSSRTRNRERHWITPGSDGFTASSHNLLEEAAKQTTSDETPAKQIEKQAEQAKSTEAAAVVSKTPGTSEKAKRQKSTDENDQRWGWKMEIKRKKAEETAKGAVAGKPVRGNAVHDWNVILAENKDQLTSGRKVRARGEQQDWDALLQDIGEEERPEERLAAPERLETSRTDSLGKPEDTPTNAKPPSIASDTPISMAPISLALPGGEEYPDMPGYVGSPTEATLPTVLELEVAAREAAKLDKEEEQDLGDSAPHSQQSEQAGRKAKKQSDAYWRRLSTTLKSKKKRKTGAGGHSQLEPAPQMFGQGKFYVGQRVEAVWHAKQDPWQWKPAVVRSVNPYSVMFDAYHVPAQKPPEHIREVRRPDADPPDDPPDQKEPAGPPTVPPRFVRDAPSMNPTMEPTAEPTKTEA